MGSKIVLGKVKLTFEGEWDKSKEYKELSVVNNAYGAKYVSIRDVPANTLLTDKDYWTPLVGEWSDVYQGAYDTDPDKRLDGSDLIAGDLYFNTDNNALKVYTGNSWVIISDKIETILKEVNFQGDGSTTEFDVDGGHNGIGQIFVNGTNVTDSVDLSDTTKITFNTAPADQSDIYCVFYGSFQIADVYTKNDTKALVKSYAIGDYQEVSEDTQVVANKFYGVKTKSDAITLNIDNLVNGDVFRVCDIDANAANNNITITSVKGKYTIEKDTKLIIDVDSITLTFRLIDTNLKII